MIGGVPFLWILHHFPEASFVTGLQEPRGLLVDFDMVGI